MWETNQEKRSSVRECVRKRDGGNIYLSPDGSVLGVHLWRNEISSWLSGRGRLCCPAAYTLTQHPPPLPPVSLWSHTTCSAFNLLDDSCVCSGLCACVCVRGRKQSLITRAPVPLRLSIKWLGQSPPLVSLHYLFRSIPSWDHQRNLLIDSPTKSSIHQTDTLANTLTWSFHFLIYTHTGQRVGGYMCVWGWSQLEKQHSWCVSTLVKLSVTTS